MHSTLQHIGFICDGNATWAKKNNVSEEEGYIAGFDAIIATIKNLLKYDIPYATFYVFSTENWGRPKKWLDSFFEIAYRLVADSLIDKLNDANARIKFIGDINRFSDKTRKTISDIELSTKDRDGIIVHIAASYGGRDEIIRAVSRAISNGEDITEEAISNNLDTYASPDVDLIIRTKNKRCLSNFMLWQASYSELLFIEELWPEFKEEQLENAINEFNRRTRTFGKK